LETFAKSKEKLVSWIETCNHYYQNESLRAESETIGTADVNASAKLFQWFCRQCGSITTPFFGSCLIIKFWQWLQNCLWIFIFKTFVDRHL